MKKRAGTPRKLKHRPVKVVLKGKYYCPVVPELGHYENEGLWGYDKLVHIEKRKYRVVQCLFKTEQERDKGYALEVRKIHNLGNAMLKRKSSFIENELDSLESECENTFGACKVVKGKVIRLIF